MMKRYANLILVTTWLLFTVSLAVWWMIFGLKQNEKLALQAHAVPEEVFRGQRMLHWEGAVLVLMLLIGGLALLYFTLKEADRHKRVKQFFATLTHELKTPLASLRIQVESLQEDLQGT